MSSEMIRSMMASRRSHGCQTCVLLTIRGPLLPVDFGVVSQSTKQSADRDISQFGRKAIPKWTFMIRKTWFR